MSVIVLTFDFDEVSRKPLPRLSDFVYMIVCQLPEDTSEAFDCE
jgi:hypothetical protein